MSYYIVIIDTNLWAYCSVGAISNSIEYSLALPRLFQRIFYGIFLGGDSANAAFAAQT